MNAEAKITRVSWPVEGIDGKLHRRVAVVRPWEAPPEDALDPETGEPKHWEPQHVRAYVRDAMDILKRLPMPSGGMPGGHHSGMPDVVREFFESYGNAAVTEALERRVAPTAAEISALDRVLAWLWWLPDRRDVLVVTAVGSSLSLRAVGKITGLSHERCRQLDLSALRIIAGKLNSGCEQAVR